MLKVSKIVKSILEEIPETRDNDYLLWLQVLKSSAPDFGNMPVGDFLRVVKFMKYPHFETVSRARRKVQELHPELRATEETRAFRAELEKQYREFAKCTGMNF